MLKTILMTTVLAAGLGLAATAPGSAANFGSGFDRATQATSPVQDAQYYYRRRGPRCRIVKVCRPTPFGPRCHREQICRW